MVTKKKEGVGKGEEVREVRGGVLSDVAAEKTNMRHTHLVIPKEKSITACV